MKVIRLTESLNYGGIERVFELHAKYHRHDYELIFVSLTHGGRAQQFIEQRGYRVIILNVSSKIPSISCLRRLVRLFNDEKPDVVHTCGAEANFHGLLAAGICGVKRRIAEEIGIPNHSVLAKVIFRTIYLVASRVIAISHAVSRYLTEFEVPAAKVAVIHNPIDSDTLPTTSRTQHDSFRISCACRLEPIKNLPALIDLLCALRTKYPERPFELWLIGAGSQRAPLAAYAEKRGVEAVVVFTGFVDRPQGLLVQTDVFILPSLHEGFGLACIEAIQCGLPVIVSSSGGMQEYISDGINGFLFDPRSPEELMQKTDAMMKLHPAEVSAMTARASATIKELFSPEKYLDDLAGIYGMRKELNSQNHDANKSTALSRDDRFGGS